MSFLLWIQIVQQVRRMESLAERMARLPTRPACQGCSQRREDRQGFKKLVRAMQDAAVHVVAFLASGCPSRKVSETRRWLQELCWEDLPDLNRDLEWDSSESWGPGPNRLVRHFAPIAAFRSWCCQ